MIGLAASQSLTFCRIVCRHRFLSAIESAAQAWFFLLISTLLATSISSPTASHSLNGCPSGHLARPSQQSPWPREKGSATHPCAVYSCHPKSEIQRTASTPHARKNPRPQLTLMTIPIRDIVRGVEPTTATASSPQSPGTLIVPLPTA